MPHPSVETLGFHYSPSPSPIRGRCPTTHLDAEIHGLLSKPNLSFTPLFCCSDIVLSSVAQAQGHFLAPNPQKLGRKAVIKSSFDQLPNSELNLNLFIIKLKNHAQVTFENQLNFKTN